jgi:hypothetical protein
MRLSELRDQDSYSFEVATIFVGADSQAELEAKFHACMDRLPLRLETRMDDRSGRGPLRCTSTTTSLRQSEP